MQKEKVLVILGPTSSGKTALSIELAKKYNGEIVSADSRQVYRGMNLGTGKVTKEEMQNIPHHMLDVADPKKVYSVSDYVLGARTCIKDIHAHGKLPIICGGTAFYIDAVLGKAQLPDVPPNPTLRKKLEKKSASELFQMLVKLDPVRAKNIDQHNPVRLVRAIEIAKALGKVPPLKKTVAPYDVLQIGLDMPDEVLKSRIALRLNQRLKMGMLDEGRALHQKGLTYRRMRQLGLEYGAMADLLTAKVSREAFQMTLANDIWQYAKRQRVWWKRDKTIVWFDSSKKSTLTKTTSLVRQFLTS
ncbi:MAG: tRNA (adenosine(37)-N6)-dimethylallyltransferase MiaA [bacterium]